MLNTEIRRHLRHNFIVNVTDGAFFGLGLGFASSVTVLPLFVATLTDSTILIGLIASIQAVGWQLPQLLTADHVAHLRRYRPMVILMTIHERWPYFGLAVVALALPTLGRDLALALTFIFLAWQALGGGVTATAWQSMIGKIMPADRRGTFYGIQFAGFSLLSAGGAVIAGQLLERLPSPTGFFMCFLLAGVAMSISWAFLAWTREPEGEAVDTPRDWRVFGRSLAGILRDDSNFRWFLVTRMLSQVGWMAVSFFSIYAVRRYSVSPETIGVMTGILMISQTVANPLMGWAGDRWGHRRLFALGNLLAALSALMLVVAPDVAWLYPAFALAGAAHAPLLATIIAMTAEFGTPSQRPYYIGLTNTLIAPSTILAPIVGGWLVDTTGGFTMTFLTAAICALVTALIVQFVVHDPVRHGHDLTGQRALASPQTD